MCASLLLTGVTRKVIGSAGGTGLGSLCKINIVSKLPKQVSKVDLKLDIERETKTRREDLYSVMIIKIVMRRVS